MEVLYNENHETMITENEEEKKKAIWNKRNQVGGVQTPDFKTYPRTIVTRYHDTDMKTDTQTSGAEWSSGMCAHICDQMVLDRVAKNTH